MNDCGGNLIAYLDKLITQTADFTATKTMWNSVLSTEGAKQNTMDMGNFYLITPLDRNGYT